MLKYTSNLDAAYNKGYFTGSKTRDELLIQIQKTQPQLKYLYGKTGIGLYDTDRSKYVTPIGKVNPIPKFTLMEQDTNKVLCVGWPEIIKSLRRQGYEIHE